MCVCPDQALCHTEILGILMYRPQGQHIGCSTNVLSATSTVTICTANPRSQTYRQVQLQAVTPLHCHKQCLSVWGMDFAPRYCELAPLGQLSVRIRACSAQQLKSHTGIILLAKISFWRDSDHVTDLEVFLKHNHLSLEGFEPPLFPWKWELYFSCGS